MISATDSGSDLLVKFRLLMLIVLLCASVLPVQVSADSTKTLTVMSTRKQPLVNPVLQEYSKSSGVNITFIKVSRDTLC